MRYSTAITPVFCRHSFVLPGTLSVLIGFMIAAEAIAVEPAQRHIPYINSADGRVSRANTLDIYQSEKPGARPVVIWVHGGGWMLDDKRNVDNKPKAFNERGFVLVSVNYRMYPKVDFRGMAGDVARAVSWAHQNIAGYGGDPEQMFLMGHSAGAHLSALVGTDSQYLSNVGLSFTDLKGIILLDGPAYNVHKDMTRASGGMKRIYEKIFTMDPEMQKAGSPQHHAAKAVGMSPWLIIHLKESRMTAQQSEDFAATIRAAGGEADVVGVSDTSHTQLNRQFGRDGTPGTQDVFEFLSRHSATMKVSPRLPGVAAF